MDGFEPGTYGKAFADVYDEWYPAGDDVDALVSLLHAEVVPVVSAASGARPRLLELGAGTGRLALPLTEAGFDVTALDESAAMLDVLGAKDPGGTVPTVVGDMVDDLPDGPFDVVVVACNTLFNLTTHERQARLFSGVADRLAAQGCFVVEAFVPEEPTGDDGRVQVRSISADAVVLSASRHDAERSRAYGQFIEITARGGVRLRPWSICYATPSQLDAMARACGLGLAARFADADRRRFDDAATSHISVYRRHRK